MILEEDYPKVERLIRLSETHPVLPDTFIPWDTEEGDALFMPEELVSLQGHPLYNELNPVQKRELGRMEIAQVMHSYAWSEGLACFIFNKHLLKISAHSIEYRYLLKELIEEFRHQDMFSRTVQLLKVAPVPSSWFHKFLGNLHVRWMPAKTQFMSVLAIELVTDIYGKLTRSSEEVFLPIRKVSELHHIEEGRHIYYTKLWLRHCTEKAGFIARTWYSLVVLSNILFMRSMYVRQAHFEALGVNNPRKFTLAARKNLKMKFGAHCLQDAIALVEGFRGFNFISRPLWRYYLNAPV